MKLLVTGGAGFIGSCFVRQTIGSHPDVQIVVLDKLSYAGNLENLLPVAASSRYRFVRGDICDANLVNQLFATERFAAVVHFAAESHVDRSILSPLPVFETNLRGTLTLLEAARLNKIARFHHVSTDEVYGSIDPPHEADENYPLRTSSPYSASKAGSDLLALSHFAGIISENAADPRLGAALHVPKLNWTLRAFYGRFYQEPPLATIAGPLLQYALEQGFGFVPLRGERDEERQFGVAIPFRGWILDADYFNTHARNYFDHDVLGNANIFFPLTIGGARIQAWEVALRSPRYRHGQLHLAYSQQTAKGEGAVTGGLTDFSPPSPLFFLDHDQRHTLSVGANLALPRRTWLSGNLYYGSGFLDGDGPNHLPGHAAFDFTAGKPIGEAVSVSVNALNVANHRYLIDNSSTFGGTHFANAREVYVQVKWRFRY